MKNNRLYLDIHAIQSVPSSNINRDDTGSPKTAQYGGVTRSRVSSQSWKKAIREYFKENGIDAEVGVRSLEVVRYVASKIRQQDSDISQEDAMTKAENVIKDAGIKTKDQKARALFFISDKQAQKLATAALDGDYVKKDLKEMITSDPAIDIALFGRMVADDPALNEDASSQVAHAISTHAVQTEFDFFTATDDFSSRADAGAGMLGTIEFNSSTMYRYANVAVHEFFKQLNEDYDATTNSLALFVEGFLKSMPTGKSNTFANLTIPQAVLITLRDDRPVSLVTAFEEPIISNRGFVEKSKKALISEHEIVQKWVNKPAMEFTLGIEASSNEYDSLTDLLMDLKQQIHIHLKD
ncbi:type I-E CRISPR-associated protein Cas7/Cse4/CasC [Aerococcaceae bacterium DSM 111020]|nr:type I-E CRISPR-associated protein Cas7/Cse4/CasC [Aerococcaceae bacterium DSM 111020]